MKDLSHIWTREYDRAPSNLLALQDEIAGAISDEIRVALGDRNPIQRSSQPAFSPKNYEAFDLYLKGQYFWNQRTIDGSGGRSNISAGDCQRSYLCPRLCELSEFLCSDRQL